MLCCCPVGLGSIKRTKKMSRIFTNSSPRIICIIPARLAATRFPEKILAPLNGCPLLEHVWKAATNVSLFHDVIIALDSPKTAAVVSSFGGRYVMTDPTISCGTERLLSVMNLQQIQGDIWLNWQADEPFITEAIITKLLSPRLTDTQEMVWTLKTPLTRKEDIVSPHNVKVVTDVHNRALYFSRAPIPYYSVKKKPTAHYYKHVGIYAFTTAALQHIATLPPHPLEQQESLEQLRWLAHNIPISVHQTMHQLHGIDTPHDLRLAEKLLQSKLSAHDNPQHK